MAKSPQRLKAFTLDVGGTGEDSKQAQRFLDELDLGYLLERIEVPASEISVDDAIRVLEDYKPLDVQSAAMALALCRESVNDIPIGKCSLMATAATRT